MRILARQLSVLVRVTYLSHVSPSQTATFLVTATDASLHAKEEKRRLRLALAVLYPKVDSHKKVGSASLRFHGD